MQSLGDGWWYWLYNNMNVLNTTEIVHLKIHKVESFIWVFTTIFKKSIKKSKTKVVFKLKVSHITDVDKIIKNSYKSVRKIQTTEILKNR